MIKGKRGQGLSMNTVIIGIIVLVVLIVIIAFFTGGTGTVINKIKGIFGGATATDYESAVKTCESYADAAEELKKSGGDTSNSAFCSKPFQIDMNKDGVIKTIGSVYEEKVYCSQLTGVKYSNICTFNTNVLSA